MRRALPLLLLAFALLAVSAGAKGDPEAGELARSLTTARLVNEAVAAEAPIEVVAEVPWEPDAVTLAPCEWDDAKQNATYCQLPAPMSRGADGLWRGASNEGFPGGVRAGFKILVYYANGTNYSWPGSPEYHLFSVAAAPKATPAPALVPALAVLVLAGLLRRR